MSAVTPPIEKLKGRENVSTCTFAVQAYLEMDSLLKYVCNNEPQ